MRIFAFSLLSLPIFLTACTGGSSGNQTTPTQSTTTPSQTTLKGFEQCQQQFLQSTQPTLPANFVKDSYPLCFDGFAVMYSGISRTPIWVTEYLTRQRLTYAKQLPRENNFHAESRLPTALRSELADYRNSGYDRGHLAPNADMSNKNSQFDSFSLANIAPQHPDNNQKNWVKIEQKVRELTNQYGQAYVVTGVSYLSPRINKINNRILVPSHFYKAVYFPSQNQAIAFITPNDASQQTDILSLQQLYERTGVDSFPTLNYQIKSNKMTIKF